jgi:redox-sensitive bicupin YhaK (pirin superfamily)
MAQTNTQAARQQSPAELREIEGIYRAPPLHWVGDGFHVAGYFSAIPDAARKLSPFLLLDYHPEYDYPPATRPRGVGVHPHRGFETVTLAWQGSVAHHDSSGGGGVIGPGDVQWMTAASGILHKEYHEENYSRRGGPFQMAQLWVNLPRAHKMGQPRY